MLWGGNAGGSQGQIFTGQALATQNKWYADIGAAFKNNPDVMFGTNNEPSETDANGQQNPAALSEWQLSNYNAIRGTGNNNPILLEINGWSNNGQPQMAVGYTLSVYQGMTNVIGDIHDYGTAASLGVRQQSLVDASVYRWLDETSVRSLNQACRCRPRNEPGAGDWPLAATSASAAIYSFAGSPGNWPSPR